MIGHGRFGRTDRPCAPLGLRALSVFPSPCFKIKRIRDWDMVSLAKRNTRNCVYRDRGCLTTSSPDLYLLLLVKEGGGGVEAG